MQSDTSTPEAPFSTWARMSFMEARTLSRALEATSSCSRRCCLWACGEGGKKERTGGK